MSAAIAFRHIRSFRKTLHNGGEHTSRGIPPKPAPGYRIGSRLQAAPKAHSISARTSIAASYSGSWVNSLTMSTCWMTPSASVMNTDLVRNINSGR